MAPALIAWLVVRQGIFGAYYHPNVPPAHGGPKPLINYSRLDLVPEVDGEPVGAVADGMAARVTLLAKDEISERSGDLSYAQGTVEVPAVAAGRYWVKLAIDANRDNPIGPRLGLDGDLRSTGSLVDVPASGDPVRLRVPVYRIFGLTRPEDTRRLVERAKLPCPRLRSPVALEWEPVAGSSRYQAAIVPSPGFEGGRYVGGLRPVARHEGPETGWTVELPPNVGGDCYHLTVTAFGDRDTIARLVAQGADWDEEGYYFRVTD